MKLDILMHYEVDETTGEIKFIGKEEITVDSASAKASKSSTTKKSTSKVDDNPEPLITLEANKLVLTQGAVDALNPCEDCRIDIKYKKKDKKLVPVIGTDAAFGTKAGNKLTKTNTVSYRGAANDKLSAYGTVFRLEPTEEDGIFYMVGDKNPKEPEAPKELVDIESELEVPSLEDLDNADDKDLGNFDFKL
jgi:hypothetical protein